MMMEEGYIEEGGNIDDFLMLHKKGAVSHSPFRHGNLPWHYSATRNWFGLK